MLRYTSYHQDPRQARREINGPKICNRSRLKKRYIIASHPLESYGLQDGANPKMGYQGRLR